MGVDNAGIDDRGGTLGARTRARVNRGRYYRDNEGEGGQQTSKDKG